VGLALHVGGGKVEPDGAFSTEFIAGLINFWVSELPPGWALKAIRLEGSDITDQSTDFGEVARRQVETVLTDRISNVVGLVTDRNGRVVSNSTVVMFPEDSDRWKMPSRFDRGVRSHQTGRTPAPRILDVSVGHGRTEVRVTRPFLDRADVMPVFQGVLNFVEWPLCERCVLLA
jgi:hypothetical protein